MTAEMIAVVEKPFDPEGDQAGKIIALDVMDKYLAFVVLEKPSHE